MGPAAAEEKRGTGKPLDDEDRFNHHQRRVEVASWRKPPGKVRESPDADDQRQYQPGDEQTAVNRKDQVQEASSWSCSWAIAASRVSRALLKLMVSRAAASANQRTSSISDSCGRNAARPLSSTTK